MKTVFSACQHCLYMSEDYLDYEKVYKKEFVNLTALGSRRHWSTVIKVMGTTQSCKVESLYQPRL